MAFDPHKFAQAARDAGYSDEEIVAKIREQTTPKSFMRTDYAKEPPTAKAPPVLGPSTPENIDATNRATVSVRDDSGENPVTRFIHRAIPETRVHEDAAGRMVPAPDDPVAHDPLAQMVIANQLGWGAGKLLAPAGRIISGAGNAATQTAVTGGTPSDIAQSGLIGAAIPAAGMALGKVARAVRNGTGGQARQLWEKHGGNVGPLDSGSGVDEIAGITPSRAGVGEASAIGAKNIRAGLEADFEKNAGAPYRAAREPVDYGPAGRELTDVSSLRGTIAERLYSDKTPRSVRPWLAKELDDLDAMRAPDGRVMISQQSLSDLKQRLANEAKWGINSGPGTANIKDQAIKDVANAATVLVDEGPYSGANAIYSKGMKDMSRDRASIGLRKEPAKMEAGKAAEDARVAQLLRNLSNDSEAAGATKKRADVPGFIARHPELERQVDLPDLVRAKDTLTFGVDGSATENLIQAAKSHGIGGHALEILRRNLDAASGRLAYRPAGIGLLGEEALTSPQVANVNPIIQAYLAAQQRDQERAAALNAQ